VWVILLPLFSVLWSVHNGKLQNSRIRLATNISFCTHLGSKLLSIYRSKLCFRQKLQDKVKQTLRSSRSLVAFEMIKHKQFPCHVTHVTSRTPYCASHLIILWKSLISPYSMLVSCLTSFSVLKIKATCHSETSDDVISQNTKIFCLLSYFNQILCRYSYWLRADDRVSFMVKDFLSSTSSRLPLGPTQLPIQWVPGPLSPGVKAARSWSWSLTSS
jgi:hypothetical protein